MKNLNQIFKSVFLEMYKKIRTLWGGDGGGVKKTCREKREGAWR
jgi:hypothetical protein